MPIKYGKILYCCIALVLIIIVCVAVKAYLNKDNVKTLKLTDDEPVMKYILQWTSPVKGPFLDEKGKMEKGQQGFLKRKCPHVNCFVTSDRSYFKDITKFDVIAFVIPEVIWTSEFELPDKRSPHQKYVFASRESSHYYHLCSSRFNNYFNWTWTFRLDSEVRWGYVVIRDKANNIIGPQKNMNWLNVSEMEPVSEELKTKLKTKRKAAAWFVSNCFAKSRREKFVDDLRMELYKYKHIIDIYGKCGLLSCERKNDNKDHRCEKLIQDTYYFYLSFENSFDEDYVTEKLLRPLQNYAIPIVYGGANYTRFIPDGIYLNARELGVKRLAAKMNELIQHREKYYEYFKWRKYYSYYDTVESVETSAYCRICDILNDDVAVQTNSIYKDLRVWWDAPHACKE